MRKISLLLFALFLSASPAVCQNPTESPTPSAGAHALLKKPAKPPVTAEDFYEWARWEYLNRNRKAAQVNLDQALKLNSEHVDALLLRANMRADDNDCRGALDEYAEVIRLADRPVNTYQYRGECKVKLGDYQGALRDFDTSVNLLKQSGEVQYNAFIKRGKVKYILQDYAGAVADFKAAFRIHGNPSAVFYGALTLIKAGNLPGALEDLTYLANFAEEVTRESRKKYPELYKENDKYPYDQDILAPPGKVQGTGASAGVAVIFADGGELKTEFAEFGDMIVPDNWFFPSKKVYFDLFASENADVIFFFLGQIYSGKNDPQRAIMAYSAGLVAKQYGQGIGRLRFERGKLYSLTSDFVPAVRDLTWAISEKTKLPDAYLERAIALTMLNRDDLAEKDVQIYKWLNPAGSQKAAERIQAAKVLRARQAAPLK